MSLPFVSRLNLNSKCAWFIFVAICFAFNPLIAVSTLAVNSDSKPAPETAACSGRPKILIDKDEDGGFEIRSDVFHFPTRAFLIAIERKNLRGLSKNQIESLICGPIGSKVELTLLLLNGKVKTVSLERDAIEKEPTNNRDCVFYSDLDMRSGRNWNLGYVELSSDLEARANQALLMRAADEWPDKSLETLATAALPAALTNYRVGNIKEGDRLFDEFRHKHAVGKNLIIRQNLFLDETFRTLVSVGRYDNAMFLLKALCASERFQAFLEVRAFRVIAAAALMQSNEDALSVCRLYNQRVGNLNTVADGLDTWVADVYVRAGKPELAVKVYQNQLGRPNRDDGSWFDRQRTSRIYFRLAQAQKAAGNGADALNTLQLAKERLLSVPPEQLTLIENAPDVYPHLADIEAAKKLISENQQIPVPESVIEDQLSSFPNIRACHDAICSGNKELAGQLIYSFLSDYQTRETLTRTLYGKQNLYCSILTLAREIADRNWIALSDDVLTRLKREAKGRDDYYATRVFLNAEFAYNSTKRKEDSDRVWGPVETSSFESATKTKQAVAEQLREYAVVYYYADELARADVFVRRALTKNGNDKMALLDAACIAAKQGKFEEADAYWDKLVRGQTPQTDSFYWSVIELSSIYSKSKKIEQATAMLKQIYDMPRERGRTYQVDNGMTALDLSFADLLLQARQVAEAHKIASAAAKLMPGRLSWPESITIAKCAEATDDFAEAAKFYSQRPWTNTPMEFDSGDCTEIQYMQKALSLADKAPAYDRKAMVELCDYIGQKLRVDSSSQLEALKLYQRIVDLTPNSDPKKPDFMFVVASLKDATNFGAKADDASSRAANNTLVDRSTALAMKIDAAKFAEINHVAGARTLWIRVATEELTNGQEKEALRDIYHSMDLYDQADVNAHDGIFGWRSQFIECVKTRQPEDVVEKLLMKAISKTQAVAGEESVATHAQMTDLFIFYVEQKKYDAALKTLDSVLNFKMSTGETLSQSLTHSHCGPGWSQAASSTDIVNQIQICVKPIEDKESEFVKNVHERVLKALRRSLEHNDERLVSTLASLGDVNFLLQNYIEADRYYSEAYKNTQQFHKGEFAVRQTGQHYADNCRKLGNSALADKLMDLGYEGVNR